MLSNQPFQATKSRNPQKNTLASGVRVKQYSMEICLEVLDWVGHIFLMLKATRTLELTNSRRKLRSIRRPSVHCCRAPFPWWCCSSWWCSFHPNCHGRPPGLGHKSSCQSESSWIVNVCDHQHITFRRVNAVNSSGMFIFNKSALFSKMQICFHHQSKFDISCSGFSSFGHSIIKSKIDKQGACHGQAAPPACIVCVVGAWLQTDPLLTPWLHSPHLLRQPSGLKSTNHPAQYPLRFPVLSIVVSTTW